MKEQMTAIHSECQLFLSPSLHGSASNYVPPVRYVDNIQFDSSNRCETSFMQTASVIDGVRWAIPSARLK